MLARVHTCVLRSAVRLGTRSLARPVFIRFASTSSNTSTSPSTSSSPSTDSSIFPKTQITKSTFDSAQALAKVRSLVREADRFVSLDDLKSAETLLIAASSLGKNHPSVQKDKWHAGALTASYAYIHHREGKHEDAAKEYQDALEHLKGSGSTEDAQILGMAHLRYAELLAFKTDFKGAEEQCKNGIEVLRNQYGPSSELVGLATSNLASFVSVQGRAEEAAKLAQEGLAVLAKVLGKAAPLTRQAAVNVAKLLEKANKPEELAALDQMFTTPDEPLGLQGGSASTSAAEVASQRKEAWGEGYRRAFDLPGLFKSSALSAQTYRSFLDEWSRKGMAIDPAYCEVIESELKSLGYSFDNLKKKRPAKAKSGSE